MTAPNLTDVLTAAQGMLEGKLARCVVTSPTEILRMCGDWRPEVNLSVRKFWNALDPYRDELEHANIDGQMTIINKILMTSALWIDYLAWQDYSDYEEEEDRVTLATEAAPSLLRDITAIHHALWGFRVLNNHDVIRKLFAGRCSWA